MFLNGNSIVAILGLINFIEKEMNCDEFKTIIAKIWPIFYLSNFSSSILNSAVRRKLSLWLISIVIVLLD